MPPQVESTIPTAVPRSYGRMTTKISLPADCWEARKISSSVTSDLSVTTEYEYYTIGCAAERPTCCPSGYDIAVTDSEFKFWSPGVCPTSYGIKRILLTTISDASTVITTTTTTFQAMVYAANAGLVGAGGGGLGGAGLIARASIATGLKPTNTDDGGRCCPTPWALVSTTIRNTIDIFCTTEETVGPEPLSTSNDASGSITAADGFAHTTIRITIATPFSIRARPNDTFSRASTVTVTSTITGSTMTGEAQHHDRLNTGAAAGVAIGVLCLSAILGLLVFYQVKYKGRHGPREPGRFGFFVDKFQSIPSLWRQKDAPEPPDIPAAPIPYMSTHEQKKDDRITQESLASPASIESEWHAKPETRTWGSQEHAIASINQVNYNEAQERTLYETAEMTRQH